MLMYLCIWIGLFVLAFALTAPGLMSLTFPLFPLPVAIYWARGRALYSLGLVACAGLACGFGAWALGDFALAAAVAGLGVLMGVAAVRRWRFGWCVAVTAGAAYVLAVAVTLTRWASVRQNIDIFVNGVIAQLQEEGSGQDAGSIEGMTEALRVFGKHFEYLGLGMLFGTVLLSVTVAVVLLARCLRRSGTAAQLRGSFRTMQTPDWVVWLAIATALLWFVDNRWPNHAVRMIAWNSASGLTTVYWLNGLSIVVYAMGTFPLSPIACYAIILALFWFQASPALCVVGLFDTWWDFRQRFALAAEARRLRKEMNDNDNP